MPLLTVPFGVLSGGALDSLFIDEEPLLGALLLP